MLQLMCERLRVHISTTVYCQVLIYTAEWTGDISANDNIIMTTQEYAYYNRLPIITWKIRLRVGVVSNLTTIVFSAFKCLYHKTTQNSKQKHEHEVRLSFIFTQIHRVVVPETKLSEERLSFAFFARPNFDCVIKCLDGSDKYEPITPFDQLSTHLLATGLAAHGQ